MLTGKNSIAASHGTSFSSASRQKQDRQHLTSETVAGHDLPHVIGNLEADRIDMEARLINLARTIAHFVGTTRGKEHSEAVGNPASQRNDSDARPRVLSDAITSLDVHHEHASITTLVARKPKGHDVAIWTTHYRSPNDREPIDHIVQRLWASFGETIAES